MVRHKKCIISLTDERLKELKSFTRKKQTSKTVHSETVKNLVSMEE